MPQLDLSTYNITSTVLLLAFWTYFSLLYIAVSYTSQKIASAYYFKFYIVLISILAVNSLEISNDKNLDSSENFESSVVFK